MKLPFVTTWMDLKSIMLTEISQTEKDKYFVITYLWNLKNKTNVYNSTETDSQIKIYSFGFFFCYSIFVQVISWIIK